VTEVYDYLRILFARLGKPYCPDCEIPIGTQTSDEIIEKVMSHPTGTKVYLMTPLEIQVGERYETLWEEMRGSGYVRMRVDGVTQSVDQAPQIDRRRKHAIEVVVDRATIRPDARSRIADSITAQSFSGAVGSGAIASASSSAASEPRAPNRGPPFRRRECFGASDETEVSFYFVAVRVGFMVRHSKLTYDAGFSICRYESKPPL
jgi:excinuclease UvrABC ATPase subunit